MPSHQITLPELQLQYEMTAQRQAGEVLFAVAATTTNSRDLNYARRVADQIIADIKTNGPWPSQPRTRDEEKQLLLKQIGYRDLRRGLIKQAHG